MKKLILIISLIISSVGFLSAQENNTAYVIFTSTRNDSLGVIHLTFKNFNKEFYRSPSHHYKILNRSKSYFFKFQHRNWNDKPDKPVISKPVSFLETVEYIDWDVIGPTLTKEQAEAKYREIISHPKIYFIDRNEIEDGMLKMVPVEVYKSRI